MQSSLPLVINNIGLLLSALLMSALIILIYLKDHRSLANKLLMGVFFCALLFIVSHLIGINVSDPLISRDILMFNMCNLFLSAFFAHFTFVFLGKQKEQKWAIIVIYSLSIILFLIYIIFPDTFLLPSTPKLYFPNYYVPGSLDIVMRVLSNVIIPGYTLIYMLIQYPKYNRIMKGRLKYIFIAFFLGYFFGGFAIPLIFFAHPTIFGVLVDPLYAIFFAPFFAIPFTYAVLKYQVLDIRIVAQRAFIYAISVAGVGLMIVILDSLDKFISQKWLGFPEWIVPFTSSIIVVSIAFIIWTKLRESDILKYEFITIVTHKFRTPLTQIRWAAESIEPNVSAADKQSMDQIKNASYRLIELTNLLVRLSDTDSSDYEYQTKAFNFGHLVADCLPEYIERAQLRNIAVNCQNIDFSTVVFGDETKIKFVVQIFLDNAISYNSDNGNITISVAKDRRGKLVILSMKDTGIGLKDEEMSRLFHKFWRSSRALKADTEGMGIGLFMAKGIVERQGGKMWAESEGAGKGSTFYLQLPLK